MSVVRYSSSPTVLPTNIVAGNVRPLQSTRIGHSAKGRVHRSSHRWQSGAGGEEYQRTRASHFGRTSRSGSPAGSTGRLAPEATDLDADGLLGPGPPQGVAGWSRCRSASDRRIVVTLQPPLGPRLRLPRLLPYVWRTGSLDMRGFGAPRHADPTAPRHFGDALHIQATPDRFGTTVGRRHPPASLMLTRPTLDSVAVSGCVVTRVRTRHRSDAYRGSPQQGPGERVALV